jgi:DNA-binding LytR/AlgR family response regulator
MKVVIIEDEKLATDSLEQMLLSIDGSIQVLAKIESVRNAVRWLSNNKADLIFLDVQLSDGISFNIFEQVNIKTPVIFTTAYDQYAIKAFKLNSIDYLLKPIDINELRQSIDKYKIMQQESDLSFDIKTLMESLKKTVQYQTRFLVHAGQKIKSIKTSEIAYLYVRERDVYLCTHDNKHYDIDYTLDKLQEILDPNKFFRINRQYIIHIDAIENMYTISKSRVKIGLKPPTEEDTIVSFNNAHEFKLWLNR